MKILIVSGIFEPESGGPAVYTPKIAEKLAGAGNSVSVIAFSPNAHYDFDAQYAFPLKRIVRGNKILNRVKMSFAVFRQARNADLIYMLDWFAAGLPAALAGLMRGVPYVVRVGGDYLWEQKYLESDAPPVSLSDFYERGLYQWISFKPFFWLIRFVLSHARMVIFNSDKQKELYGRFYGLKSIATVCNPVPRMETRGIVRGKATKEFVYLGRFIVMKNLTTLIRAFAKAQLPDGYTLLLIGDGPRKGELMRLVEELGLQKRVSMEQSMRLSDALERIKNCRAFILPSWTDISPNQVYEALAIGLPAVVSKENYLSIRDRLPEMIDPASVSDVASKLEILADDRRYKKFSESFASIKFARDWDDVAREHIAIFNGVLNNKAQL
ncbi:MAG TPA: glycosyltransferase [Candidatus Paceibacterota bacterium]|nr:glycosyltransferase [Candidatus Paceibacterota bacterium]